MKQESNALRLADELKSVHGHRLALDAAAELRRLHELNRQLTEKGNREVIRNARLEEANKELLEALRDELEVGFNVAETPTRKRARALIAKAGETK